MSKRRSSKKFKGASRRRRSPDRRKARKLSSKEPDEPTRWNWRDKFVTAGVFAGLLVTMVAPVAFLSHVAHQNSIRSRVANWKDRYELSESEADRLLRIELDFHRYEKLFSLEPDPTPTQVEAHSDQIAELLGTEVLTHSPTTESE